MYAGINDEASGGAHSAEWYDEKRYDALLHHGENSTPVCISLPLHTLLPAHTSLS